MLNLNVRFTEEPALILTSALPNGKYDVWLRKGIGSETKTDDEGNSFVEYYAEQEAYARQDEPFNLFPGDPGYEAAFEAVAAWNPANPDNQPDMLETLRKKVESLSATSEMLTECILEMSEIIYV